MNRAGRYVLLAGSQAAGAPGSSVGREVKGSTTERTTPTLYAAYGMAAGNVFEASEYCVIIESSTLYYDVFAQCGSIGNLYYLKEGIFNNGIGKSCGDISHGCAFLLRLLYL